MGGFLGVMAKRIKKYSSSLVCHSIVARLIRVTRVRLGESLSLGLFLGF